MIKSSMFPSLESIIRFEDYCKNIFTRLNNSACSSVFINEINNEKLHKFYSNKINEKLHKFYIETLLNDWFYLYPIEKNIFICQRETECYILYNLESKSKIELIKKQCIKFKIKKINAIEFIYNNNYGFYTKKSKLINPKLNIEINYGKHFLKTDKVIKETLKLNNKSGIVLLHGDPGTGKTTYIKHLIGSIIKYKKVIYMPPSMAAQISHPNFISFMFENKNSIIVIEDAEEILASRSNERNSSVQNLLNVSDGIMGDVLNIQIICTFNCHVSKIDQALKRKGRIISEHEFKKLSIEDSINVTKFYNLNFIPLTEMTLADIFNHDKESYLIESKKIGFNV